MRHAKTESIENFASDFDRELTDRGQHEPVVIAKLLQQLNVSFDKAIVSPARRTKETWDLLKINLPNVNDAIDEPRLYEASLQDFIEVIKKHVVDVDSLLIIAHCPAVIEAVRYFTGEYHDFKPADLAIISCDNFENSLDSPQGFTFEKKLTARSQ